MADDAPGPGFSMIAVALFGLIFILIGWDLNQDLAEGAGGLHMVVESAVLLLAAGGIGLLLRRLVRHRTSLKALAHDLEQVRRESQRWREDSRTLIEGLGAAIQNQFRQWALTAAEAEVALLLVKGLSLKEIAALRKTSERTVREQAQRAYRKAGIAGRTQLAAFFLEDLLLPVADKPQKDLRITSG